MERNMISDARIGDYLTEDVKACVGKRGSTYVDKFYKVNDHGYSFNWCAALFAQTWFGYRKMWKGAAVITAANIALSALTPLIMESLPQVTLSSTKYYIAGSAAFVLILFIVCGVAGDWFYCKHVTGILDAHQCKGRPAVADPVLEEKLQKAGGVSFLGLFGVWAVNLVLSNLVTNLVNTALGLPTGLF